MPEGNPLGYLMQPEQQAPQTPQNPEEFEARKNEALEFLQRPDIRSGLLQFAINVLQPTPIGSNPISHIASSVGSGGEAVGRVQALQAKEDDRQFKQDAVMDRSDQRERQIDLQERGLDIKEKQVNLTGGNLFGNSLQGRALDFVTKWADAYAKRQLTPEQENYFNSALTVLQRPTPRVDPTSGRVTYITPPIPPQVKAAIEARERTEAPESPTTTPQPQSQPQPGIQEAPAPTTTPKTGTSVSDTEAADDTFAAKALKGVLTGVEASVGRTVSDIPYVGDLVTAPEMNAAAQQWKVARNKLARLQQQSPRFAATELERIIGELPDTSAISNPQAFVSKLVGVDRALSGIQKQLEATVKSPSAAAEEVKKARALLPEIASFRRQLLPPVVTTNEAYEGLQEGATFMYKDKEGKWVIGKRQKLPGAK